MSERRILLIGRNGQVGWELQRALPPLGSVIAMDKNTLDLRDADAIRRAVRAVMPQVVVNAAAYTAVDRAESEADLARAVNAVAPRVLAEECRRAGALLVHYSTDYVFDGKKGEPYLESDAPGPLGVYGETKLAGDRAVEEEGGSHLILRTSWVYGARGSNFLRTMLRLFREREEVRVVDDQHGAPTWSRWIAEATAQVLSQRLQHGWTGGPDGAVYNLSGGGETTWYGFAQAILEYVRGHTDEALAIRQLTPISTADYPTPVERPRYSKLSAERLASDYGIAETPWDVQLRCCLDDMYSKGGA